MNITERAETISRHAHKDNFHRDGVTPYITHVEAVVSRLKGQNDSVIAAAWLHDVIEDTETTLDDLRAAKLPEEVVVAVDILTHRPGENYFNRYIYGILGDTIARKVKLADVLSNLAGSPTNKQIRKYALALLFLVPDV